MRFQHVLQSRPDWYDRGAVAVFTGYNAGGVAPHAGTQRWTYTVAAGKKLAIQCFDAQILRITAAAAVAEYGIILQYVPSGGGGGYIVQPNSVDNAVSAGEDRILGSTMVLTSGDVISAITYDGSTGGTVSYNVSFQGLLFDA